MNYIIHYDICAIVIYCFSLVIAFSRKNVRRLQTKIYILLAVTCLVVTIFDLLSAYTSSMLLEAPVVLKDAFNLAYLFFHNITSYIFLLYVIAVCGLHHKIGPWRWILFSLPVIVISVLFSLNGRLRWIFYYDEMGVYKHGSMMWLLYAIAFFYVATVLYLMIAYRQSITGYKRVFLSGFILLSMAAIVAQMIFPDYLIEMFAESIAVVGMLLAIENSDDATNPITGVYNRRTFLEDVEHHIAADLKFTVVVIKLSRMRYYQETLGIRFADDFQHEIARWLSSHDKDAEVYECGIGTFALLVFRRDTRELVEKIEYGIRTKLKYAGVTLSMPVELRCIQVPVDVETAEMLTIYVDRQCTNNFQGVRITYASQLKDYRRSVDIENAITKALEMRSFKVFYQPIWSTRTGRIESAEALLRLYDDVLGWIPPEEMISIAEKNGQIFDIGRFVLEEVCRFFSSGMPDKLGIHYIEVNLSIVQCMMEDLQEVVWKTMRKYNVLPEQINFEITESTAVNNSETILRNLNKLLELGSSLSLDDFGTGYSTMTHLIDIPFRLVKLDKSLLWSAQKDEKAMTMMKSVIKMVKRLGLELVVEGVETQEHVELLTELGCEYLQGYYFSRPVEELLFVDYCRRAS